MEILYERLKAVLMLNI